ncbi:hypothetical protein LEMLEM_LOCUS25576 [Lemmus lemmus]
MGLQPLEFSDCYLDSPWFRERIRAGSGAGEDQQVLQRAHQRWEEPHRCHQNYGHRKDDGVSVTLRGHEEADVTQDFPERVLFHEWHGGQEKSLNVI